VHICDEVKKRYMVKRDTPKGTVGYGCHLDLFYISNMSLTTSTYDVQLRSAIEKRRASLPIL